MLPMTSSLVHFCLQVIVPDSFDLFFHHAIYLTTFSVHKVCLIFFQVLLTAHFFPNYGNLLTNMITHYMWELRQLQHVYFISGIDISTDIIIIEIHMTV